MSKKKQTGTAIVKWDEEFAQYAKETADKVSVAQGKFISFAGGRMSFAGEDIPDNELRCVVVGWNYHNAYYDPDVRFDPKDPQTPLCYAFGETEEEMEPHADAPEKQCESCADCPFNEFGSSSKGEGKACKNTFRIAVIAEDDLNNLEKADVVYISVPPKSLKNWSNYLGKDLVKLARPHWSVITLVKRVPDDESQFRILFSCEEIIEDSKLFAPLKKLWQEATDGIDFPYPPQIEKKKVVKKTNSKFKKKGK